MYRQKHEDFPVTNSLQTFYIIHTFLSTLKIMNMQSLFPVQGIIAATFVGIFIIYFWYKIYQIVIYIQNVALSYVSLIYKDLRYSEQSTLILQLLNAKLITR